MLAEIFDDAGTWVQITVSLCSIAYAGARILNRIDVMGVRLDAMAEDVAELKEGLGHVEGRLEVVRGGSDGGSTAA